MPSASVSPFVRAGVIRVRVKRIDVVTGSCGGRIHAHRSADPSGAISAGRQTRAAAWVFMVPTDASLPPHWFQILPPLADRDLHGLAITKDVFDRRSSLDARAADHVVRDRPDADGGRGGDDRDLQRRVRSSAPWRPWRRWPAICPRAGSSGSILRSRCARNRTSAGRLQRCLPCDRIEHPPRAVTLRSRLQDADKAAFMAIFLRRHGA
jgi:hypothetical protein